MKIRPVGAELFHTDGRTGMTMITVAFRNLLKEPQNNQINLLKPTGYVMHQQFNIQQFYALPTLYLSVLYLSENKQRLVPLTA